MIDVVRRFGRYGENAIVRTPGLHHLYWPVAPRIHGWFRQRNDGIHSPVFEMIQINPLQITHYSGRQSSYFLNNTLDENIGRRVDGDWDTGDLQVLFPYTSPDDVPLIGSVEGLNQLILPSFKARFLCGKSWEETPIWAYLLNHIEDGAELWHGCTSEKDVRSRAKQMDELYFSMKNGYESALERAKKTD